MRCSSLLRAGRIWICAGWSLVGEGGADFYVAKTRRRRAVAGAHGLHGLALAAIGRAPENPMVTRTDGVAGIPELGGDAAVAGIFEHARFFAAFDFPADFGGKLELVAAIVDGPGTVGFHEDGVVGVGD